MKEFGLTGFLSRWIPALILVLVTYNPTQLFSYYHWVMNPESGMIPVKVLAGVILLIGYGIYLTATWKSMKSGVFIVVIFFMVLLWVFNELGWLKPDDPSDFAWIALIVLATILAIGMSWAGIWRRLTGQVTTDSIEDNGH